MFTTTYDFSCSDVVKMPVCVCCGSNQLKQLSFVIAPSTEGPTTYLETSACQHCGHIQRSKILQESWMLANFASRDAQQLQSGFNPINQSVEEYRYQRYSQLGKALLDRFPQIRDGIIEVVDIGCGPGSGIQAWLEQGIHAKGVEPDTSRARYGLEKGIPIEVATWQNYKGSSSPTPTIYTCIQSFEHFYDAEGFLDHFSKMMTNECFLFIEVPDSTYHISDWNDSLYLGHVNNFNENSLRELLNRFGFNSIYRLKPYADPTLTNETLCLLASKSANQSSLSLQPWEQSDVDNYLAHKTADYHRGLPHPVQPDACITFKIPEINDLMFSFKNPSVIADTVKENESQRTIEYLGNSSFSVK